MTTEKGIYYPTDYSDVADIPADMKEMAESIDDALTSSDGEIEGIKEEQLTQNTQINNNKTDIAAIKVEQTEQNTDIQANTDNIEILQSKVDLLESLIPTDTATGESLTLSNTARYPFKEFNVGGNTEQQSYTGKNLVNVFVTPTALSGTELPTYSISEDGYVTYDNSVGHYASMVFNTFEVEASTKYYSYADITTTSGSPTIYITELDENNASLGAIYPKNTVFTTKANTKYLRYAITTDGLHNAGVYTIRPMIVKSETADNDYEPYVGGIPSPNPSYPQEIENVSGEVEVKVENKNIYNSSLAVNNMYQNYNNPYWSMSPNNNYWCTGLQKIKPNTNYTISRTPNITVCYDKDRNPIPQGLRGATITTQATAYYMNCCYVKNSFPFGSNLQIEEGSTATSYEPHEEQTATFPLAEGQVLHIGDTLEDDGIHITRGQQTYNGTEAGIGYNDTQQVFSVPYNVNKYKTYNVALCNQYQYTTKYTANLNNYEFTTTAGNGKYLFIKDTRYNTVDDYKAYLVEQYNNGTPLIAQLELITPTVIPYTAEQQTAYNNLKNLYSYKGTTYISSSNEPSPVFEVVYRKSLG